MAREAVKTTTLALRPAPSPSLLRSSKIYFFEYFLHNTTIAAHPKFQRTARGAHGQFRWNQLFLINKMSLFSY